MEKIIGKKWGQISKQEQEELLKESNCFFNNNEKYGECIVDLAGGILSVAGILEKTENETILIIKDDSVIYNPSI